MGIITNIALSPIILSAVLVTLSLVEYALVHMYNLNDYGVPAPDEEHIIEEIFHR